MTDEEMESRLLHILMQKYRGMSKPMGLPIYFPRLPKSPVRLRSWTDILSRAGCELMPLNALRSDENDIFVNHRAIGTMRIPREVAIKILALGGLP